MNNFEGALKFLTVYYFSWKRNLYTITLTLEVRYRISYHQVIFSILQFNSNGNILYFL